MKDVLAVADVAVLLDCSDVTVRERAAELGGLKFGRDWVFPTGALFFVLNAMALEARARLSATPAPSAVLHSIAKAAPPVLPTSTAPPSPRRAAKRSEAPSPSTTTP